MHKFSSVPALDSSVAFVLTLPSHMIPRYSHDRAYVVKFLYEELIPRVHAGACLPGADVGKLRQQTLIYILMDTEESRLTCKTAFTIM